MPSPLPYFNADICPFPLPHFALIFFAYLWPFRWPNYIVTLPRYFSSRLPHLNIPTRPPADKLDKNIQRTSLRKLFSHWNGYYWPKQDLQFKTLTIFSMISGINIRENRSCNKELTIQKHQQHWTHNTLNENIRNRKHRWATRIPQKKKNE